MANYESRMRTSYFQVKNEEEFLETMNNLNLDIKIVTEDKGIVIYGSDFTYTTQEILADNGDYIGEKEIDVLDIIQSHLKDGETVLINSIGYEKMRYLHSTSVIITSKEILSVSAEEAVKELAVKQGLLTEEQALTLECIY
ncbi:hypothetical protein [Evansella clarkii]|uniref:hypothetical protein n=1 Tax=Evansella clarkii TaxID=79879 RepID=UPI0011164E5A|nr:hypothetical protein [Evansella clarkii]